MSSHQPGPDIPRGLLLLGFGGHARSVADVALSRGVRELIFVDDAARPGERFAGHPVQAQWPLQLGAGWQGFAAAGGHADRAAQIRELRARGWPLATVVSAHATVGVGAAIGPGSFIGHHAHIGPLARVGEGVIINTAAVVEHDCQIGDYSHVSVQASVAGRSRIGARCFVCTGATVIDRVSVGDDIIIGAGAVVVADLQAPGTYLGVPARPKPRAQP